MITEAQCYIAGWKACMNGVDGRYASTFGYDEPYRITDTHRYAWEHGFLDAMEADDDEQPEPSCAGY